MFDIFFKNRNKKRLKDKRFNFLFDEAIPNEYVCLDCETSGLNPKKDEILSIGAVYIKENKILMRKTFNIFLKPSKNIMYGNFSHPIEHL
jgi:DNA polymerase-3 subunit epsilon